MVTMKAIDWDRPDRWTLPPLISEVQDSPTAMQYGATTPAAPYTFFSQAQRWIRLQDSTLDADVSIGILSFSTMTGAMSVSGTSLSSMPALLQQALSVARDNFGLTAIQGYTVDASGEATECLTSCGFHERVHVPGSVTGKAVSLWQVELTSPPGDGRQPGTSSTSKLSPQQSSGSEGKNEQSSRAADPHQSTVRGVEPTADSRGQDLVWDAAIRVLDTEQLHAEVVSSIQTNRGLCEMDALVMNCGQWVTAVRAAGWTGVVVNETLCAIRAIHKPSRTYEVSLGECTVDKTRTIGHYAHAYFRARTILVRSECPLPTEPEGSSGDLQGSSGDLVGELRALGYTTGLVFTAGVANTQYWYSVKVGT